MKKVIVIGAGLAGCEAAWQTARQGVPVTLYEMKPGRMSPAHHSGDFAELVCSNSFRADGLLNAVGVLKEEMRALGGLMIRIADEVRVPAGGALAVDRVSFSRRVTEELENHPLIAVCREEVTEIPDGDEDTITIVATGPLTDGAMAAEVARLTDENSCYFYDAAAPIVTYESIDMTSAYFASRYGKGDKYDYINCPLTEEEYEVFYQSLITAERAELHQFEKELHFEGCMPVETIAARGRDTLLFGPLKPVGLENPATGERPYAVVQLRHDDAAGTLYNLVGFQTNLKWPEQRRVFGLIPALKKAEFVRYGVMHRNTFVNSPLHLLPTYQLKKHQNVFLAGQMTGVEGYLESASAGLVAGLNAGRLAKGEEPLAFPADTAHGALAHYITTADPANFQPMNVTFGLMPPPGAKQAAEYLAASGSKRRNLKKAEKKELQGRQAVGSMKSFIDSRLKDLS